MTRRSRTQRPVWQVLELTLTACLLVCAPSMSAAAESANLRVADSREALWQQSLLLGIDARSLVVDQETGPLEKSHRSRGIILEDGTALHSIELSEQVHRLNQDIGVWNAALRSLRRASRPWQMSDAIERLNMHHRQLVRTSERLESNARSSSLDAAGASQMSAWVSAEVRLGESLAEIRSITGQAMQALNTLQSSPVRSLADERSWRDALTSIKPLDRATFSTKRLASRSLPISSRLPYGPRNLLGRALSNDDAIVPSYANQNAQPGAPEDLLSSPMAGLDSAILSKAAELEYDYVRIHEFVRLQVRTEWYAGAMKGATGTLGAMSGNDVDQAALLIALLRASGAPARFVGGTIELPMSDLLDMTGLSGSADVLDLLSRSGTAFEPVIQGGSVSAVRLQHTWVSAYVPYDNYRGTASSLNGRVWLPMAPSIKQIEASERQYSWSDFELNARDFVDQYLTQADPTLSPQDQLLSELETWLIAHPHMGSLDDQVTRLTITEPALEILPSSLPFVAESIQFESITLPDELVHWLDIRLRSQADAEILSVRVPVANVLARRVLISAIPASRADADTIASYGGATAVPNYLVNMRPVLNIGGQRHSSAEQQVLLGEMLDLHLTVQTPGHLESTARSLTTGALTAISVNAHGLDAEVEHIDALDLNDTDGRAGRYLANLGTLYHRFLDQSEGQLLGLMDLLAVRASASVSVISVVKEVAMIGDLPLSQELSGVTFDAAIRPLDLISRRNEDDDHRAFVTLSAFHASWLEGDLFDSQWHVGALSTVSGMARALALSNDLVQINPDNLADIHALLDHDLEVIEHIRQWVQSGHTAHIPSTEIEQDTWSGAIWTIEDTDTGAIGYFIHGAYAGGTTTEDPSEWMPDLRNALNDPESPPANLDPGSANRLIRINQTDSQIAEVNHSVSEALAVKVLDANNRPVQSAEVTFTILSGDASLRQDQQSGQSLTAISDGSGIARVDLKFGQSTRNRSVFGFAEGWFPGPNATRFGAVLTEATLPRVDGTVLRVTLNAYSAPSDPVELRVRPTLKTEGTDLGEWVSPDTESVTYDSPSSSHAGGYAGSVVAQVVDEFGNEVSNVPLQVSADQPFWECGPLSTQSGRFYRRSSCQIPELQVEQCEHLQQAIVPSEGTVVRLGLINGEGGNFARFPFTISSQGLGSETFDSMILNRFTIHKPVPDQIPMASSFCAAMADAADFTPHFNKHRIGRSWDFNLYSSDNELNLDNTPEGARLEQVYSARKVRAVSLLTRFDASSELKHVQEIHPEDGVLNLLLEGQVEPVPSESIGNGYFVFDIPAADLPQQHAVEYVIPEMTVTTWEQDVDTGEYSTFTETSTELPGSFWYAPQFYSVEPYITRVSPNVLALDDNDRLAAPLSVGFDIQPPEFKSRVLIHLLEDGQPFDSRTPPDLMNSGEVLFTPEKPMDLDKDYTLQIELQLSGSDSKIITDEYGIDTRQSILRSLANKTPPTTTVADTFERRLQFFTEVDIPNQTVCTTRDLNVQLFQDATIDLRFERLDDQGQPTGSIAFEVIGQSMVEGENLVEVSASDLGTGQFRVIIDAVADSDGSSESRETLAHSNYLRRNSLPIGHAIVKGVDLFDGSMVVSRKDIVLPGYGANLEFTRTYSSKGRSAPGTMGYGWSHNYHSSVTRSQCGIYTVVGAEGGSINFVETLDGFEPMKGYHGALVRQPDGSLDFYPKGGNRYHFTIKGNRQNQWSMDWVETPNGKRTTLTYHLRQGGPLIESVTDSAGKSLQFNYQLYPVNGVTLELIASISGPGGIELTFEYSPSGDLIEVRRENDSIIESYQYSENSGFEYGHLLVTVTDGLSGATRRYQFEDQIMNIPLSSPPMSMPGLAVSTLTEPDGGMTRFDYSVGTSWASAETTVTDGRGFATTYTMNEYGASTRIDAPNGSRQMVWDTDQDVLLKSETDENGTTTTYQHDQYGNILRETIGEHSRVYQYAAPDAFEPPYIKNRVQSFSNWRGLVTQYSYDPRGNLLTQTLDGDQTRYSYDSAGNRRSMTDPNGNSSLYGYDASGNLISETNALGHQITRVFDLRGRRLSERDARGHTVTFEYDDRDRLIQTQQVVTLAEAAQPVSVIDQVIYDDINRVRIEIDRRGHSTVHQYDLMGRLTHITNALGDQARYQYDVNGNKTSEFDWLDRSTTLEYDGANRLELKTEPLGKVTRYVYDPVGNLLRETIQSPDQPDRITAYSYHPTRYFQNRVEQIGSASSHVTEREHDAEGNVIRETSPRGFVTQFTHDAFNRQLSLSGPLGSGKIMVYDPAGNLIEETMLNSGQGGSGDQRTLYGYDQANRLRTRTDPLGFSTTLTHDANNNVIREIDARSNTLVTTYNELNQPLSRNHEGAVSRMGYDRAGNLITETWPNGNVISTQYDPLNRVSAVSDSIGALQAFDHDAAGNVILETSLGVQSTHGYNDLNQRISTTRPLGRNMSYSYTVHGELIRETDAAGQITTHTVDAFGRRLTTVGPEGLSLAMSYDQHSNLTSITDSRGTITTQTWNELDQQLTETVTGIGGPFTRQFEHDQLGNRLREVDRRGIESNWQYDLRNQMTRFTRANQVQEQREYDSVGNLQFQTDANGNTAAFDYNGRNQVIRESRPMSRIVLFERDLMDDVLVQDRPGDRDITTTYDLRRRATHVRNAADEVTATAYDVNNNPITRTRPNGTTWTMEYDIANRLEAVINPLGHRTEYLYDSRDNRINHTDARGRITQLGYDNRSRQISKTWPDGVVMTMEHDANNNLISMTEPNGTTGSYEYDALNRMTDQTITKDGDTIAVAIEMDPNGNVTRVDESNLGQSYTCSYQYDILDRLSLATDQFGQTLQFSYDANGNRTSLLDHNQQNTRYTYDALNRLDSVQIPGLATFTNTYQQGTPLLTAIGSSIGSQSSYDYDQADRISSIVHTQAGGTVASVRYAYDQNGNRLTQHMLNGALTDDKEALTSYSYDDADRLTEVTYPDRINRYTLDEVSNRTQETITDTTSNDTVTRLYDYNTRDQLISLDDSSTGITTYSYDDNGNRVTTSRAGITTIMSYSPRNRMIRVSEDNGTSTTELARYRYDHKGLRIEKTAGGNTTRYLFDDTAQIAETNVLGNTLARYHYNDRHRIAEQRGPQANLFFHDALGTVIAMIEQQGTLNTRYDFDAWGNLTNQQGTSTQPFGFTGYQRDEESDFYYAQQRYYDSSTGVFTREDPMQGKFESPPTLHRYLYASGNPLSFIDPTGLYAEDGHYYTTMIVAEALGFSAEEVNILALYSQLPDEVDSLDATEMVKNKLLSGGLMGKRANDNNDHLHSLNGQDSAVETSRTIRAIIHSKSDLRAVGLLVHRLGDNFAHRVINDESKLYRHSVGHLFDFHEPDVIQNRPDLYAEYVRTLVRTLAAVKGGMSTSEIEAAVSKSIERTETLRKIKKRSTKTYAYSGMVELVESDSGVTRRSISAAREIVRDVNEARNKGGEKLINERYQPENVGPGLLCCWDVWIVDALDEYSRVTSEQQTSYSSRSDYVISEFIEARASLSRSKAALDKQKPYPDNFARAQNKYFISESSELKLRASVNE